MAWAKTRNQIRVTPDGTVEQYDKKGKLIDPDVSRCPFCGVGIIIASN